MPVHDWKKPDAGLFHHFHQQWAGELCDALNAGVLPDGCFALIEQKTIGVEPDVMTLDRGSGPRPANGPPGGLAVTEIAPKTRFMTQVSDQAAYARKANRIAVRYEDTVLVAVVEFVSPGNKHDKVAIKSFIEEATEFLARGVNLLIVDLFPPTKRDPQGIHKAIWDEIEDVPFELPPDKRLTAAAYIAAPAYAAYVEPVAIGDPLPELPLFLGPTRYVPAPLESSYMRTWEKCPSQFRDMVVNPKR